MLTKRPRYLPCRRKLSHNVLKLQNFYSCPFLIVALSIFTFFFSFMAFICLKLISIQNYIRNDFESPELIIFVYYYYVVVVAIMREKKANRYVVVGKHLKKK